MRTHPNETVANALPIDIWSRQALTPTLETDRYEVVKWLNEVSQVMRHLIEPSFNLKYRG
jgi:hypothetical protein